MNPTIQTASDAILREGRMTEIPAVSPDAPLGLFDGEDRDVFMQGDLAFVHGVRSGRGVLIQGSILGSAAQSLRVEAKGDVIVTGAVRYAQLSGRRVLVGGRASHSQFTASQQVAVGDALDAVRVIAGDYEDDRRCIESCRLTKEQSQTQTESLTRRVCTEEKRLDKACRALRIPLDFNVGRIVQHEDGRVCVDLGSFYESLDGRTDEQLELALAEFFAKGVIGVITRANRKYLVNFPAREKVFMQLVKSLRELFEAVLERDRLQRRVEWLEGRLGQLVDSLRRRRASVEVGGAIAGDTSMEFILPRVVKQPKDGGYDFAHQTARLELICGAGAIEVVPCGADGARTSTTVAASEMDGLRFAVDDGRVLWEPVNVAVSA
ncbi:MAG TPA: hypothetical protein QGF95_16190 [Candidatus Latescibacteria bacterium]|jgi:hypothetical protein|nr:hypothetical protein [Candidatus Latescibacterota bacterium]HJP32085.1 hypothetical protein [Candidatus Latescibacterota bacterium]